MTAVDTSPPAGSKLPAGFEDLEPYAQFAIASREERFRKRFEFDMDQIRAFYDTILPRTDAIMAHLNAMDLATLPEPERRLLTMMLMLVEVSRCVELWNGNDMFYYTHPKESLIIHQ